MSKKPYILIIIIIFILLLIFFSFFMFSKKNKTIEKILNIDMNNIAYIKVGNSLAQDDDYPVANFISTYKNAEFKKVNQDIGNTAHLYYVCYNAQNEVLFTLVEIGNQNLVFLKKGIFNINDKDNYLYQLIA